MIYSYIHVYTYNIYVQNVHVLYIYPDIENFKVTKGFINQI